MTDKTMELLNYINDSDMERFDSATAKRKAQIIIKNFQNYKQNQVRLARAKTEEEKDAFTIHIERFWLLANRQVRSLNDEEMTIYLSAIKDRLGRVIEAKNDDKVLDNKLFFGTILRQLPAQMTEENLASRESLQEMLSSLDYTFER